MARQARGHGPLRFSWHPRQEMNLQDAASCRLVRKLAQDIHGFLGAANAAQAHHELFGSQ